MDAVAAGLGAHIEDGVSGRRAAGVEYLVLIGEADRHGVDQDVAIVALVELGLTCDGRHADAVSITANAGDHICHETARLRVSGIAKAQGIDQRNGPRAHRENIPQDAAHPGRSALIGFDVGRVIVALHLEDGGHWTIGAIADIDHACILARPLDDMLISCRKFRQVPARGFIGTVLRPHHRINAKLHKVGSAVQPRDQSFPFLGIDAVLGGGRLVLFGEEGVENRLRVIHGRI